MPASSSAEAWTKTSFPPPSRTMKPNPLVALYHFTVPISWTLASNGCWPDGDLNLCRGGLSGAAVLLSTLGHLRTPMLQSHPQLQHLARLQGSDADACKRSRMEESVTGPVRELDETVPFVGVEPFDMSPNRQA
jgi:hypothetical protein